MPSYGKESRSRLEWRTVLRSAVVLTTTVGKRPGVGLLHRLQGHFCIPDGIVNPMASKLSPSVTEDLYDLATFTTGFWTVANRLFGQLTKQIPIIREERYCKRCKEVRLFYPLRRNVRILECAECRFQHKGMPAFGMGSIRTGIDKIAYVAYLLNSTRGEVATTEIAERAQITYKCAWSIADKLWANSPRLCQQQLILPIENYNEYFWFMLITLVKVHLVGGDCWEVVVDEDAGIQFRFTPLVKPPALS